MFCLTVSAQGNREEEENEAEERQEMEFEQLRIPGTNIVPSERLRTAELYKRQLVASRSANSTSSLLTGPWVERGGNNCGGLTRTIMYDPNDATHKRIFAGGQGGGIWKCDDIKSQDYVWVNINDQYPNLIISSFTYNPQNTLIMYAGTGSGFGSNVQTKRGAGIYKTIDGGATWNLLPNIQNNLDFSNITEIACNANGEIFASTESAGIQKSIDGGNTWTKMLGNGIQGCLSDKGSDIEIATDGTIYVCFGIRTTIASAWKSTNNGLSWIDVTPAQIVGFIGRIEIETAPSNSNTVFIVASNGFLNKSINAANAWTNQPNFYVGAQGWWNLFCEVSPQDENIVYLGGTEASKSVDGGLSNLVINYYYDYAIADNTLQIHGDIHIVIFEPGNPNNIVWGTDGGIFVSTSVNANAGYTSYISVGAIFSNAKTKGYNVAQYYAVAINPESGSNDMMTGSQDNGTHRFVNEGLNDITDILGGDGGFCHIDKETPYLRVGSQQLGLNFMNPSIYNSTPLPNPLNIPYASFINPTAWDNTNNTLFTASIDGIGRFVSGSNGGYLSSNFISLGIGVGKITALTIDPNFDNVVWAISGANLYRIENTNTASPTITNFNIATASGNATCIEIEKEGASNHILVTYSSYGVPHMFESFNQGTFWDNVQGNLPDIPFRWVIFNPYNSTQVLLATDLGVWETNLLNGTYTNWQPSGSNFPNCAVNMLKVRESDGLVAAATNGRGLWTTTIVNNNANGCSSPNNLSFTSNSANTVNVSWSTINNAISYALEYKDATASIWNVLPITTATTQLITGLLPCVNYQWRVKTNCSSLNSTYSYSTFVTNQAQNLISSGITNSQATISWSPVLGSIDYSLRYWISNSTSATWQQINTTSNTYTLLNLKPCTKYDYIIIANNSCSNVSSQKNNFTTASFICNAPTALIGNMDNTGLSTFSWNAVAGATDYIFEYKLSSSNEWNYFFTGNNYNISDVLDGTGLIPCATYDWRVKARNFCGYSAYTSSSFVNNTIVATPTGLTATYVGDNKATLNWTSWIESSIGINNPGYPSGSWLGSVPNYKFEYKEQSNSIWIPIINPSNPTILNNLIPNTTYNWRITPITMCTTSPSTSSTFTTTNQAPNSPSNLTAVQTSCTKVTLNWTASASTNITYTITRTNGTINNSFTSSLNNYVDNSVLAGVIYNYSVVASNAFGNSTATNIAPINIITPPAAPTNFTVVQTLQTFVLSWTAVPGLTYSVYKGLTGTTPTLYQSGITNGTYIDNSLIQLSTYCYYVVANNTLCSSNASSNVCILFRKPPNAITNLQELQTNCNPLTVNLYWTQNGGTSFTITRTGGGSTVIFTKNTTPPNYYDNTLVSGVTYTYSVISTNLYGSSTISNLLTITYYGPVTIVPVLSSIQSGSNVNLSWSSSSSSATGTVAYYIYRNNGGTSAYSLINPNPNSTTLPNYVTTTSFTDNTTVSGSNYCYKIVATTSCGGVESNIVCLNVTALPTQVTSLSATQTNCSQATLNWSSSSGSGITYTITRTNGASSTTFTTAANTFIDNSVSAGINYSYTVVASNNAGSSAASIAAAVNVLATPSVPASFNVVQSGGNVNLSWSSTAGVTYAIYKGIGAATPTLFQSGLTVASFSDNAITAGTSYCYNVVASAANCSSAPTNNICISAVSIPSIPTGLAVTQTGCTQATLNWSASTGTGVTYSIFKSGSTTALVTGLTTTSYVDNAVVAGTTYPYTVVATNIAGSSAASTSSSVTISGVPVVPTSLVAAQASINIVNLTWVASTTAGVTYKIIRNPGNVAVANNLTALTYLDNTVTSGSSYSYNVIATISNCSSSNSNTASVTVASNFAPLAPSNVVLSNPTICPGLKINISWKDNSSDETGFVLERATTAAFTTITSFSIAAVSGIGSTVNYSDASVLASTAYFYRVRAIRTTTVAPITTYVSANVLSSPTSISSLSFGVPTSFAVAVLSNAEIKLTWANNATAATGVEIWRSPTTNGTYTLITTLPCTATSYNHTGLTASTANCYKIRAVINSPITNTAYTTAICATTFALFTAAPTSLVTIKPTAGSIRLTWVDNTTTENGFEIYRSTDNITFTKVITTAANVLTYTNAGLAVGTSYYFKVRAVKLSGTTVTAVTGYSNTSTPLAAKSAENNILITKDDESFGDKNYFNLTPNPTNSIIKISYYSLNTTKIKISVFSEVGGLILTKDVEVKKGTNEFTIDCSRFTDGYYSLVIINEKTKLEKSFIKN